MRIYCFIISCFIAFACMPARSGPKLTLIVPKGYVGQVSLIRSSVSENILNIDTNGIGYLTSETYDKVVSRPTVIEVDGINIDDRVVGFSPSAFWGIGKFSIISAKNDVSRNTIQFLSFEVVPKGEEGQKKYYSTDLMRFADTTKIW